jgi:hypothetical protein
LAFAILGGIIIALSAFAIVFLGIEIRHTRREVVKQGFVLGAVMLSGNVAWVRRAFRSQRCTLLTFPRTFAIRSCAALCSTRPACSSGFFTPLPRYR